MQETIKVIKETLNRNSDELYDLNQKKNQLLRDLVETQIETYQKEDRQVKLQQELNQLRDSISDRNSTECLKKADPRNQLGAQKSPVYNDDAEKQKG